MTDWWTLTENVDKGTAEIVIYDRIGSGLFDEGVSAKALQQQLSAVTASWIDVRLNSPGGSVWDGLAIYNALREHPAHVTTHIDGLAASIASLIALAGDTINMADNALLMIHDPYVMAEGNADQMRSAASMLERITDTLVTAYTTRTGMDPGDVRAAMTAETWYTAAEAHAAGFVDNVTGSLALAASFDVTAQGFKHPPNTPTGRHPVETTTTPPPVDTTTAPDYATADALAAVERQIAALAHLAPAAGKHPLAAYASMGEYAMAVYRGEAPPMAAAPDQITSDNPGVMPPNWLQDVKRIVDFGRPGITAMGVESAGDSGLDFNWPYSTTDPATIVAAQSAEKATLNTVLIKIAKGTATLVTYGAYSDISYQLLQRSSPSYLETHNRLMLAGYGSTTDNAFVDALVAGGTASAFDYDLTADATGAGFRAAMFAASLEVETATGSPANVVLVASNVFAKAGVWTDLVPLPYGTQNVGGTADAGSLNVNVSGLRIIHDRNLAAGSIIVTNDAAASWIEAGPQFATAEIVSKLGRDVAVYGFGCTAIYNPAGVVKVTNLA